jgi:hypothetical protein
MPNQESTAINDLIHLVQGRRLERESENPIPEVYVTAASRAQAAPPPARIASGTTPPPIAQAASAQAPDIAQAHARPARQPQVAAKPKYMLPIVEQDEEQTELWNDKAEVETAPAVPAIAPHLATVIATPATVRAVPAILSGPIAPESPAPKPSRARKIVYGAMPSESSPMPSTVVASSAAAAMPSSARPMRPDESRTTSSATPPGSRAMRAVPSNGSPSSAGASRAMHSRAMPAAAAPSRAMPALAHPIGLGPQFPAVAMNVALPPAPKLPPSAYLIARELVSSATRWGGLAFIALIALGIGIYVALDGREKPKPAGPTERDRAIAIMNGETPPPEPTVVHAPPAGEMRVEAEATAEPGTTAYRPAEPAPETARASTAVTAEPIEPTAHAINEPSAQPGKPTAEPIEEEPADEAADETIALDDIEMEPTSARPSPRASRSARARKAKLIATTEVASTKRTSRDPVLAILAEKPSKRRGDPVLAILAEKPAKQRKDKPKKAVKEVAVGPATEIAAPKGAPAAKGTGKVTIASNVAALIFLDGRATGKTAPAALVVPAGDHQITLLEPRSKKAKTATVKIAANKTASVRRDFN